VVNIFHCFFGGKSINIEEALFELCFGGLCMAPRAPAVMTISGVVFHPLCAMSFITVCEFYNLDCHCWCGCLRGGAYHVGGRVLIAYQVLVWRYIDMVLIDMYMVATMVVLYCLVAYYNFDQHLLV
jgi:hypothetical protein